MALGPWSVNPAWQNFSSLFREASAALDAPTDMEKSHHLTASLYFGIAALEAFLNQQMRFHLASSKNGEEIFQKLRTGRFLKKIKAWPAEIIGRPTSVKPEVLELIEFCNDIRGDLTHPKTIGHDIYERLFAVEPMSVVDAVANYIVCFHEAQGARYPYWVFGWNYLNPRQGTHEIILINDQQFTHSLVALGFDVPSFDYGRSEVWKDKYLATLEGYVAIRDALLTVNRCEPKFDRFPFQPKLCRRWWTTEHHKTCGYVSEESLANARKFDEA
ncbi:hypothetical protein [Thiobacillus sp.]